MTTKMETDENFDSIKKELFDLVHAYDNGISEADLSKTMNNITIELRMKAINALTNESKIQLCKRGSDLIYRAIDAKTSANHSILLGSNISIEERAVYQVIENAGSKGIWNREIRNQTKLPLNQMSKVLKNLETKKLIKAVKSVTASKKKLYMLYGLEPDKSVTGGAWYSGTEFESEYVQILHEQCYQFVRRRLTSPSNSEHQQQGMGDSSETKSTTNVVEDFIKSRESSLVSSTEVKDYIDNLKISNVKLSLQDIEMVLETIVFDGLIEKITRKSESSNVNNSTIKVDASAKVLTSEDEEGEGGDVTHYYRALIKFVESSAVMRVPCGQCPYIHECRPNAVITPEKCLYFERWFSK